MVFVKTYPSAQAAEQARAHHAWLARLGTPVPRLLRRQGAALRFETIAGHHVGPDDLPAAAVVLAEAHAAGHRTELHRARLDAPYRVPGLGELAAFIAPRIARVQALLDAGAVPAPTITATQARSILTAAASESAAFYKDANPRNFLVTNTGVVVVDFDDLTLAPFGYDLAKLCMTTAMTHGLLAETTIQRALNAYNQHVPHPCTTERLNDWMEIHYILNALYLGRHGYTHPWRTSDTAEARNR